MKRTIKNFSFLFLLGTSLAFASCSKDDGGYRISPSITPIEKETDCTTELTFMDPGMCGGAWFKTKLGEYIEVYNYPNIENLEKGDKVTFGYFEFKCESAECDAMTSFEEDLYNRCSYYRQVKAKKECFE